MKAIIKRQFLFVLLLAFNVSCFSQEKRIANLLGEWKSVKTDYRGFQKFSKEQANKIGSSILIIEKTNFFYSNIQFVKPCSFHKIIITKYDTVNFRAKFGYGGVETIYTLNELCSQVSEVKFVDETGKPNCYNECTRFYLKQDTLINVCGGYTFFLIKEEAKKKSK